MSTTKKQKKDKIDQEQNQTHKQKKPKHKKKKKDYQQHQSTSKPCLSNKSNKQLKPNSIANLSILKQQKNQIITNKQKHMRIVQESAPMDKIIDPIQQQLSLLKFDQFISPQKRLCLLINSHLQQMTINLYENMIMKSSLIENTIELAKKSMLRPRQYFSIDYTNKLLLIKKLLITTGTNKYQKYIHMIDIQVDRVQKLVLRSLQNVKLYDQVFLDLKKLNIQWEFKQ